MPRPSGMGGREMNDRNARCAVGSSMTQLPSEQHDLVIAAAAEIFRGESGALRDKAAKIREIGFNAPLKAP